MITHERLFESIKGGFQQEDYHIGNYLALHRNLRDQGSFRRSRGQRRPLGKHDLDGALNRISDNPQIALRPLANITNIPKSIIGRMTQMQGLHPFHYKKYMV